MTKVLSVIGTKVLSVIGEMACLRGTETLNILNTVMEL